MNQSVNSSQKVKLNECSSVFVKLISISCIYTFLSVYKTNNFAELPCMSWRTGNLLSQDSLIKQTVGQLLSFKSCEIWEYIMQIHSHKDANFKHSPREEFCSASPKVSWFPGPSDRACEKSAQTQLHC